MAKSLNKDGQAPDATGVQPAAGRVEFDSRGNSVWRWAKDVIDSTSILLKRLDNTGLSLEPTQKVPVMGKADKRNGKGADLGVAGSKGEGGRGFDPYNSRRR